MSKYNALYIHKISPKSSDSEGPFEITDDAFNNKTTLAKAMRKCGILSTGQRLREFRVEGDKTITFPANSVWHAIILEPADNYTPQGVEYPGHNRNRR